MSIKIFLSFFVTTKISLMFQNISLHYGDVNTRKSALESDALKSDNVFESKRRLL